MTDSRHLASRILTILIVLYSVGTGLLYFRTLLNTYPPAKPDDVVTWESRMQALKNEIPEDQMTISYVSDWDTQGYNKDVHIEFALTKYALAPRMLVRDLQSEWIIANSTENDFIDWLSPQIRHPFTVQEFGNGLYLIHQGNK
jgi:hypothetical protein